MWTFSSVEKLVTGPERFKSEKLEIFKNISSHVAQSCDPSDSKQTTVDEVVLQSYVPAIQFYIFVKDQCHFVQRSDRIFE